MTEFLVAVNVDTGHSAAASLAADGVHVLAVTGLVVQEPEAARHDEGDDDQHRDTEDGIRSQRGEVLVQGADGGTAGVDQADTVDHLLHTQGCDKGLDFQVTDDQPLARPTMAQMAMTRMKTTGVGRVGMLG